MLIYSAIAWALSESHGNYQGSHRRKVGAGVSVPHRGGRCLAGLGLLNFLIGVGGSL